MCIMVLGRGSSGGVRGYQISRLTVAEVTGRKSIKIMAVREDEKCK